MKIDISILISKTIRRFRKNNVCGAVEIFFILNYTTLKFPIQHISRLMHDKGLKPIIFYLLI